MGRNIVAAILWLFAASAFGAWSHIGDGTGAGANNGNVTPTLATHTTGDALVCVDNYTTAAGSVATPMDWSLLTSHARSNGITYVFGKIAASASETNPTFVVSGGSSGDTHAANCSTFRGGTLTLSAAASALESSGDQTWEYNAYTPADDDTLVLIAAGDESTATSVTTPSGFTEAFFFREAAGNDSTVVLKWLIQTTATMISAGAMTANTGSTSRSTIIFALEVTAAGVGGVDPFCGPFCGPARN